MVMHAANLNKSERLQRVDAFLSDGLPHSTMEIIQGAHVASVSATISELRRNGREITCKCVDGVYFYIMAVGHE